MSKRNSKPYIPDEVSALFPDKDFTCDQIALDSLPENCISELAKEQAFYGLIYDKSTKVWLIKSANERFVLAQFREPTACATYVAHSKANKTWELIHAGGDL
jgi:hypothetical protein